MSVGDGPVEVLRVADATAARDAARRLLAAGVPPEVERDGDEHVVQVLPAHLDAAVVALGLDPAALRTARVDAPGDAAGAGDEPAAADPARPAPPAGAEPASATAATSGTDDDADLAELVVDDRGFVVVAVAADGGEARALAGRLVERGIGPELVPAVETGHVTPAGSAGDPISVQVLEVDVDRALSVLGRSSLPARVGRPLAGAPAPPGAPDAGHAPGPGGSPARPGLRRRTEREEVREHLGGRVRLTRRQLRTIVALYLAALILVPLAFFFLTRELLSEDVEGPVPTFEPRVVRAPEPLP